MNTRNTLTRLLLASLILTASACGDKDDSATDDSTADDSATDDTSADTFPETCADVLAEDPSATDGAQTLYWEGDSTKPWDAWCRDMTGNPEEYLVLANTGPDQNFSEYTVGVNTSGESARTTYTRVRLDVSASMIMSNDQAFSTTQGTLYQGDVVVTVMAYASAASCGASAIEGVGNVDLRGTPFTIADNFSIHGYEPTGEATLSDGNQVAVLSVYGSCGSLYPDSYQGGPANLLGQGGMLVAYGGN
ncbi:MAG: hypothetical protein H6739_39990 [Alphaproteobacteria bacterium]|nr:hypothetical protein [Alphaproteobacteria bacterium]